MRKWGTPGPGGYSPRHNFSIRSDGFTKFGTSKRAGIYNERMAKELPAPDNYNQGSDITRRAAPRFGFGSQTQRPKTSSSAVKVPGPGQYEIKSVTSKGDFRSPSKTLHSRLSPSFERPGANKFPGPGSYDGKFSASKLQDPQWRFGSSTRYDEMKTTRRIANFPPPNSYDP